MLFTNGKGDVLLGLRRHEPAKGTWWYVGGRMRCGERVEETARRHAARGVGVGRGRLEIFIRDHEHDELGISGARTREERDVRRERGADGDADG